MEKTTNINKNKCVCVCVCSREAWESSAQRRIEKMWHVGKA